MSAKKIIIICFTFPPYEGIGGRRWAKFAKYLDRMRHDVQVLASSLPLVKKDSSWTKDIENLNRKPIYLKSGYQDYLGIQPQTFIEKLKYRKAKKKSE